MRNSVVLILLLVGFSDLALSQDEMYRRMPNLIPTELEREIIEQAPQLFGGRPVEQGELKPSVYIGNCTATIVGTNVLLTAGHCRGSGDSVSFTLDQTRHSGSCIRHPQYSQGGWLNNDFALCKFSPEVRISVFGSLEKKVVTVGEALTMQGYGAGSNGRLNYGDSLVFRVDFMDIITRGKVYLGGGDSGGALFAKVPDLVKGPFIIVGVNSRGDNSGNSYFNQTGLERSQEWFENYARTQGVGICGVNKNCNATPAECADLQEVVDYLTQDLAMWQKELTQCRSNARTTIKF